MVQDVLESIKERMTGSQIRVTDCTITFQVNTSDIDPERTSTLLGECINHINDAFGGEQVHAKLSGKNSILISSEKLSKAAAAQWVYDYETSRDDGNIEPNSNSDQVDFLFVADHGGEDRDDDEELFDWANQKSQKISNVITVATSSGGGLARWRLGGINGLLNALLVSSKSST
jgi:trehalose-6-phosphatase